MTDLKSEYKKALGTTEYKIVDQANGKVTIQIDSDKTVDPNFLNLIDPINKGKKDSLYKYITKSDDNSITMELPLEESIDVKGTRAERTADRFGITDNINKLTNDLLALDYVTKVEYDLDGYYDNMNAPITLVFFQDIDLGSDYFAIRRELKKQVLDVMKKNGVKVEMDEWETHEYYFYIVAYSTNWDTKTEAMWDNEYLGDATPDSLEDAPVEYNDDLLALEEAVNESNYKTIKVLPTRRNTWYNVLLIPTKEEARDLGFSLMYEDEEGSIFGVRDKDRMHSWEQIAFVPYDRYYDNYFNESVMVPTPTPFNKGTAKSFREMKDGNDDLELKVEDEEILTEAYLPNNVNEDLLEFLFSETDFSLERDGTAKNLYPYVDSYDQLDEYYVEDMGITEKIFNATLQYLEDLINNATYYDDGSERYIQLSDNRTLWDIDNEGLPEYVYSDLVEDAMSEFKANTGVDIFALGQSGRHICVEYTLDNLINYSDLADYADDLEREVIDYANSYNQNESINRNLKEELELKIDEVEDTIVNIDEEDKDTEYNYRLVYSSDENNGQLDEVIITAKTPEEAAKKFKKENGNTDKILEISNDSFTDPRYYYKPGWASIKEGYVRKDAILNKLPKELEIKYYDTLDPTGEFRKDYEEYLSPSIEVKVQEDGRIKAELRYEASGYDSMINMANALTKVVEKYDSDAYFDVEDYGILNAYLDLNNKYESLHEGIFNFGAEEAEKYGDLIQVELGGKTVSKRKDLAEEPGGLIYEAEGLGIDMWDLLKALEGMCSDGRAAEIDDSTYKIYPSYKDKLTEDLNRKFVLVDDFEDEWKQLGLTDEDLRNLQNLILKGNQTWIPLGGEAYKIRFSPKNYNKGKNSALRSIFVDVIIEGTIYLVKVFSKADQSDINIKERQRITDLSKKIKEEL